MLHVRNALLLTFFQVGRVFTTGRFQVAQRVTSGNRVKAVSIPTHLKLNFSRILITKSANKPLLSNVK